MISIITRLITPECLLEAQVLRAADELLEPIKVCILVNFRRISIMYLGITEMSAAEACIAHQQKRQTSELSIGLGAG